MVIKRLVAFLTSFLALSVIVLVASPHAFAYEQSAETVTAVSDSPITASFTPLHTDSGSCDGFTRAQLWWNGSSNSFSDFINSVPPNSSYPNSWLDAVSCSVANGVVTLTYNRNVADIGATNYIIEYTVSGNEYFTNFFTYAPTPVVNTLSNVTINPGDTYSANGSFTDTTTGSTSWTATVDYGDGSSVQSLPLSGMNFTLNHQYTAKGIDAVTVTVTGNQGASGSTTATVTVGSPPQISALSGASILQGQTYTENGSFTDTGSTSWSATGNYGDSTGDQVLTLNGTNFSLTHQYNSTGSFTATIKITDNQGLAGTASTVVTVSPPASYEQSNETVTPIGASPITFSFTPLHTSSGSCDGFARTQLWWNGTSTSFSDFINSVPPNSSYPTTWLDAVSCTVTNGMITLTYSRSVSDIGAKYYILGYIDDGNRYFTKFFTFDKQITALDPATVWIGKNLLNIGLKLDLKAEVYKDSTLVSSGQLNSVTVGTGGNPTSHAITFNSFSPVDFPAGSQLKVEVYARNACSGSLFNSGTANLYFNSSADDSRFGATIGNTASTYHLHDGFLLGTSAGTSQKTVSVAAGAKCSPFKSFGTWTITP